MGIPNIGLEKIAATEAYYRQRNRHLGEYQDASILPTNIEELLSLLTQESLVARKSPTIDKQLGAFHEWPSEKFACKRAAELIISLLQKNVTAGGLHIPKPILKGLDWISFKNAMRKNRLHHNINFCETHHRLPNYLEDIADQALQK